MVDRIWRSQSQSYVRPLPARLTAMQEIAALIFSYAVLVDYRVEAASAGAVVVLRISCMKTLQVVQGLWPFLEIRADLMTPEQMRLLVRRSLQRKAEMAIPSAGNGPVREPFASQ